MATPAARERSLLLPCMMDILSPNQDAERQDQPTRRPLHPTCLSKKDMRSSTDLPPLNRRFIS